ncbi:MAG: 3-oxoacyl-ACP reductase FabG [Ignavibacteriales bacterium]|nr:3-oxoacyl-ACP reductase FabG [Ignavibacteriales bacterium]
MISLSNKVSVITGGSRGIGAATALLLAKAGSNVVLNYLQNKERATLVANEIKDLGRSVIVHQGNVALQPEASNLIERTILEFGRIDVVINNAGIWTYGEVGNMGEKIWDETIEVNLKGVFNICNAVVPHLKRNGGGRIVNISSTAGQRGEAFHSHYAASKGGILAFTKSIASELAPYGILVNAVAPGWVDTEMNDSVFADQDFKNQVVEAIPLKKIATAEDVAGAVLFLASEFARHVTGTTINVNGGSVLA